MGNYRPLDTKCWVKFLILNGFSCYRITSSHHQYKKAGKRTIPVWGDEKQIPALHLKKGCETIGCTLEELYKWAESNC